MSLISSNDRETDITNSINLLISILVRYPSLGSVNFLSETNELKFSFILKRKQKNEFINNFDHQFNNSISLYHKLTGIKASLVNIDKLFFDEFLIISIKRDLFSLTQEEISFINEFVRNYFFNYLVVEEKQNLLDEELQFQEELIETMLEALRKTKIKRTLFAFREEGKVLVFNK